MIKADKFESKAITSWVNYYLKKIRRYPTLIRFDPCQMLFLGLWILQDIRFARITIYDILVVSL